MPHPSNQNLALLFFGAGSPYAAPGAFGFDSNGLLGFIDTESVLFQGDKGL